MALHPVQDSKYKGKKIKAGVGSTRIGQRLSRFTVVWTNLRGVPFTTTGFFATLSRNGVVVARANFDNLGVVVFNLGTPLTRSFTLRVFDRFGNLFRVRFVPAGVEAFVIIG